MTRLGRRALGIAAAVLGCAALGGWSLREQRSEREAARALAATDLAALQRCLAGEPLRPGETLGGRLRGVELGIALDRLTREERARVDGGAADAADMGDAGAEPAPAATLWPMRCAPFAESLARHIDESGDPSLDALRDALPTPARFALPYALMSDEAAELAAGIEKAGLPARPADNEPAPPALAAPIPTAPMVPLGKGMLPRRASGSQQGAGTDLLATSTLHLLVVDAHARICALDAEGPAGPYGVARCGDLPEWVKPSSTRFPNLDDGAPLAVHVSKETQTKDGVRYGGGILVFPPGGMKIIPIHATNYYSSYEAWIAADGAYMIPAYTPLIRLGKVSALTSADPDAPAGGDRTVTGMSSETQDAFAAYGMVFFNDRPPIYDRTPFGDSPGPGRRFHGRRVDPVFEPALTDLGPATEGGLTPLGGCRSGSLRVLLFDVTEKNKARLVLVDGDGPLRGFDAPTGTTRARLYCGPSALFLTSMERAEATGPIVVVQTRCAGTACEVKRSGPIAVPAGRDIAAATFDGGVVLTWVTDAEQVTSAARGMAFYKVGSIDTIAAAPPRPLFEGARRGGADMLHSHLIPRPKAAIVVLETGGKEPATYAARIDASGAAAAVKMEETKW